MTIRAQQTQVSLVSLPVAEAPAPCVAGLLLGLCGGVDVVNVERADVGVTAPLAFATEFSYQFQLPLPVPDGFTRHAVHPVPLALLAFNRTVARLARLAAVSAFAVAVPPMGQVALAAAILPGPVPQPVGVHLLWGAAAGTDDRNWFCSHAETVSDLPGMSQPGYFDIACRRIEAALKQPDLFVEPPKPVKQEAFL